jgi:hypothetical protein
MENPLYTERTGFTAFGGVEALRTKRSKAHPFV